MASGISPSDWKKGNIGPVYQKNDKQCLNNYRPISLLPICSKIFERLIFNEMFEFFIENDLISQHQSGFKPGDSCINQLLSITHEIYQSFDEVLDVLVSIISGNLSDHLLIVFLTVIISKESNLSLDCGMV